MKNTMKKSLSVALGTTFVAAMSAAPVANADTNPFGMKNMESGYMQVADAKCGEGKCGGKDKAKMKEAKCGEGKCGGKDKAKMKEAKCGEEHKKAHDGKCGGDHKSKEAKCGEGKCGGKN